MSKSYKKTPGFIVEKATKSDKRLANKQIRRESKICESKIKHSDFKRIPKECHGFKVRWTLEEAIENFKNNGNLSRVFDTEEEVREYWKRCSIRK